MAGLDPAIHAFLALWSPRTWMPGTSPGMTSREILEHLEIFAMLPFRHLGLETFDLGVLDVDVIVDEFFSERAAEERIVVECGDRLAQRLRQQHRPGLIRCVGGGAGIEL